MHKDIIQNLAIGLGPSNLSLAALATSHAELEIEFIERKKRFDWYEGLLLPSSTMQSSFVRDLVTLVDPTSPFSFLSYLHENKRMHLFLAAGFGEVPRFEFNEYFKWAAGKLSNVSFGESVNEIHYAEGAFEVHTGERVVRSRNLVLGIGNQPYYPVRMLPHVGDRVFHGLSYSKKDKKMFAGKRVVVVGGGQTGAEVFLDLFQDASEVPASLSWISRRPSFSPMEESPFLTEVFSPEFSEFFYPLPQDAKRRLLDHHKLASDGISHSTLATIYQSLYRARYFARRELSPSLMVDCEVVDVVEDAGSYTLAVLNRMSETSVRIPADIIILCTGLEFIAPAFLYPLKDLLTFDESGLVTDKDFSARLKQDIGNKIYVQNGSTLSWGVSDRNLVMSAWRSAKIINSLVESEAYDLGVDATFQNWAAE